MSPARGLRTSLETEQFGVEVGKIVSKEPYISGRHRSKNGGMLGRTEHFTEDDRPFAEIRKSVHDALRIFSLHRWAFFIPFSLVTCSAFIGSLYLPVV